MKFDRYTLGILWKNLINALLEVIFKHNPLKTTVTEENWSSIKALIEGFSNVEISEDDDNIKINDYSVIFGVTRIQLISDADCIQISVDNGSDSSRTFNMKRN
jgi:hypothetical protein